MVIPVSVTDDHIEVWRSANDLLKELKMSWVPDPKEITACIKITDNVRVRTEIVDGLISAAFMEYQVEESWRLLECTEKEMNSIIEYCRNILEFPLYGADKWADGSQFDGFDGLSMLTGEKVTGSETIPENKIFKTSLEG